LPEKRRQLHRIARPEKQQPCSIIASEALSSEGKTSPCKQPARVKIINAQATLLARFANLMKHMACPVCFLS